jgi:hypothetical protein
LKDPRAAQVLGDDIAELEAPLSGRDPAVVADFRYAHASRARVAEDVAVAGADDRDARGDLAPPTSCPLRHVVVQRTESARFTGFGDPPRSRKSARFGGDLVGGSPVVLRVVLADRSPQLRATSSRPIF